MWIELALVNTQSRALTISIKDDENEYTRIELHPTQRLTKCIIWKPNKVSLKLTAFRDINVDSLGIEIARMRELSGSQAFWGMVNDLCIYAKDISSCGVDELILENNSQFAENILSIDAHRLYPAYKDFIQRKRLAPIINSVAGFKLNKAIQNNFLPNRSVKIKNLDRYLDCFCEIHGFMLNERPALLFLLSYIDNILYKVTYERESAIIQTLRCLLSAQYNECVAIAKKFLYSDTHSMHIHPAVALYGLIGSCFAKTIDTETLLFFSNFFLNKPNLDFLYFWGMVNYLPLNKIELKNIMKALRLSPAYRRSPHTILAALGLISSITHQECILVEAVSGLAYFLDNSDLTLQERAPCEVSIEAIHKAWPGYLGYDRKRQYASEHNIISTIGAPKFCYAHMHVESTWQRQTDLNINGSNIVCLIEAEVADSKLEDLRLSYEEDVQELSRLKSVGRSLSPLTHISYCQWGVGSVWLADAGNAVLDTIKNLVELEPAYIFFLPWVLAGGADLIASLYIKCVHEWAASQSPRVNLVCILTDTLHSDRLDLLPPSMPIINIGTKLKELNDAQKAQFIAHLLVNIKSATCHIINSREAYLALDIYGLAISRLHKLAVTIFCSDRNSFGLPDGYGLRYRNSIANYCDFIFSDNKTHLDEIFEDMQLSKSTAVMQSIYTPVPPNLPGTQCLARHSMVFGEQVPPIVLWAGRFDCQKRLDILLAVAKILPKVEFHVYGYALFGSQDYWNKAIDDCLNVRACGKYSSFLELPYSSYACFVLTSEWEGLPVVLLEAASCGMPIVSSSVGGIKELLNDTNSHLISPHDNIKNYVSAIKLIIENPRLASLKAARLLSSIREIHSLEKFRASLISCGYINGMDK